MDYQTEKVSTILRGHFEPSVRNAQVIYEQFCGENIRTVTEQFQSIFEFVKKKQFNLERKSNNTESEIINPTNHGKNGIRLSAPIKNKRGRPAKQTATGDEFETSDNGSLNDSASSSFSRNRRAAAQAADHKLAQVQSFIKATKLRRPTDFDEKLNKRGNGISSPPSKCRKTYRKQSAGSSGRDGDEEDVTEIDNHSKKIHANGCSVSIERLSTPTITRLTKKSSINTDTICKRSEDLFNNSTESNDEEPNTKSSPSKNMMSSKIKQVKDAELNETFTVKGGKNKRNLRGKKGLDSGISSNEDELNQQNKEIAPVSNKIPNKGVCKSLSSEEEFKGFVEKAENNLRLTSIQLTSSNTSVRQNECITLECNKLNLDTEENELRKNDTEVEDSENKNTRQKNKILTKKKNQKEIDEKDQEVIDVENLDESPNTPSKTAVIMKAKVKPSDAENNGEVNKSSNISSKTKNEHPQSTNNEINQELDESPIIRSRTKVIKKANIGEGKTEYVNNLSGTSNKQPTENGGSEDESVSRSRTKTIRKKNQNSDVPPNSSEDEQVSRSRTKTIRKGTQNSDEPLKNNPQPVDFEANKLTIVNNLKNTLVSESHKSPAPGKGDLVKKRVEVFEKLKNGVGEVEEETTGRVITRNAAKNKAMSSSEPQMSKQTRGMTRLAAQCIKNAKKISLDKEIKKQRKEEKENFPMNKLIESVNKLKQPLSVDRDRLTPLATSNRATPTVDSTSRLLNVNKGTVVENSTVLKQTAEEAQKRKKEEERLRRQGKEDEAKKKKEKTLKSSAEETRRKREERLQKATAAREAAEREKALLAVKAEKEKEEKMRQIAAEKEKQKEELLKKKLLMQQKALEHEERRKQEEAARLAKLREQEEEHKRVLAIKEREQELHKQQLRLAEAEKAKQHHQAGNKHAKLATVNGAAGKLQKMTPSEKNVINQQSYEITPAREDRPLLQPKTENDYGLDDANSEDSSDEESHPKKIIPLWAQHTNREQSLNKYSWIPSALWRKFMTSNTRPDIDEIFAGDPIKRRVRTSSAVWNTPPRCSHIFFK